jgi:hypothetical protein
MALCNNCGNEMGTGVYCGGCGQRTGGAQGGNQQPQYQQPQIQQPQYQQPQIQQPQYQQYSANAAKTNGMAIAAFVLSLFCCNLLAVIFGHMAISQINRTGEGGKGLATAALIIGYLSMVGGVIYFFAVAAAANSGY